MDFSVSSLFLHLCSISLHFHYHFFRFIVFQVSFSLKVEFFIPFGFCPSKRTSGFCKLRIGWDLCWVFVSLFFLWWARLSEMVILSADDWVCIFVLFVVGWDILHRELLVVGFCQVLYYSGFLCVSSHYLILPRVSSLVV